MSVPGAVDAWRDDDESGDRPRQGGPLVDEAAFTDGFRQHHAACLRLARSIVRDEGLAHEVVQEVFLAWWRSAGDGYRADRGALAAWLLTITHHKAVDAVRTSERQRRLLAAAMSQVQHPRQQLVDELVWWELGRQRLTAALSTLTTAQQEVLGLAYDTGLTQAEIAERLGIPLGTVKSRTHAGMLRLRAAIGGTWTPTGSTGQPEDTPTTTSSLQEREGCGGTLRPRARTAGADVEVCAAALVRIAAEEGDGRRCSAALVARAAALVDEHGEAGLHGLLVALARLAAAGAPSPLRASSDGASGSAPSCAGR